MKGIHSFKFDLKANDDLNVIISKMVSNDNILGSTGNGLVKLYDINTFKTVGYFGTGQPYLTDLNVSNIDNNVLICCCKNGILSCYDIRINNKNIKLNRNTKLSSILKINVPKKYGNLYSCDINNNIIISSNDNNIIFWDKRYIGNGSSKSVNIFSGYHSDIITKTRFININGNKYMDKHFISISEDGLINEYLLNNSLNNIVSDDDKDGCLINTYSCDNSLWNFGTYKHGSNDYIYGLTNHDELIIHGMNDSDEMYSFNSDSFGNINLIDCFYDYKKSKELYIIGANSNGKIYLKRIKHENDGMIENICDVKYGNKDRIRCSQFLDTKRAIITAGEDNTISVFKLDDNISSNNNINSVDEDKKVMEFLNNADYVDNDDDMKIDGYGPVKGMGINIKSSFINGINPY